MYEYLSGKLISKTPTTIILENQGIGYQLTVPVSTFSSLPSTTEPVKVLTHFLVKEDAQSLYGFATEEERLMFRLLISVAGIGPKTAITALSGVSILELKRAIIQGALAVLTGIPGIGKKTAERIIIELREKIVIDEQAGESKVTSAVTEDQVVVEDSIQALVELGYRKQNAKAAVKKVLETNGGGVSHSVSDLIRESLKKI